METPSLFSRKAMRLHQIYHRFGIRCFGQQQKSRGQRSIVHFNSVFSAFMSCEFWWPGDESVLCDNRHHDHLPRQWVHELDRQFLFYDYLLLSASWPLPQGHWCTYSTTVLNSVVWLLVLPTKLRLCGLKIGTYAPLISCSMIRRRLGRLF